MTVSYEGGFNVVDESVSRRPVSSLKLSRWYKMSVKEFSGIGLNDNTG